MNQVVNGNMNLFCKEVSNSYGGKVENYSRIKDGNERLALEKVEVRRIWNENFEGLYNTDT